MPGRRVIEMLMDRTVRPALVAAAWPEDSHLLVWDMVEEHLDLVGTSLGCCTLVLVGGLEERSCQAVERIHEQRVPGLHEPALELVPELVLEPGVAAAAQVELVLPVRAAC